MPKPVIKGYTPDWGSVVGGVRTGQFSVVGMSDEIISQLLYVSITGTFTGTVYLERFVGSAWTIVDTFNGPETVTFENPKALRMRLRCAALSGGVVNYAIEDVYVSPTAIQGPEGDPGPPGPSGSGGSISSDRFESRAAIEAAHIPITTQIIHTEGFAEPGDGGEWSYVRLTGTPDNYYDGRIAGYISRPNLGYVQSADGQWWRGVTKNTALRPECWGAKADLWIHSFTNQQFDNGSINPSPTDNLAAFLECFEFIVANRGNYGKVGAKIQAGYGSYYFSDTIDPFYRSIELVGMGLGGYNSCTSFVIAAGKRGIHVRSYGEAPADNRSIPTFRSFELRSLGKGGFIDKHGIDSNSVIHMEEVRVANFGGDGLFLFGNAPGSDASYFFVHRCVFQLNALDGMELQGGDTNIGTSSSCFFAENGRWGLNDHAFLGNAHQNHHTATNGSNAGSYPVYGGAFRVNALNGPSTLFGCYSEGDQHPSECVGHITVIGGIHAAGINMSIGATFQWGEIHSGGAWFDQRDIENFRPLQIGLSPEKSSDMPANTVLAFSSGVRGSDPLHSFTYQAYDGWGFQWGNSVIDRFSCSFVISSSEGSYRMVPSILPNHALFPKGIYFGGIGEGSAEDKNIGLSVLRRMWVTNDPLSITDAEHRLGNLAVATDGRSLGRVCYTGGVKATSWASGTHYFYSQTIKTAAGRVYWLDRAPYNPDGWIMPRPITRATHTSGTVAYTEPNELYDPLTGLPYGPSRPGVNATEHPTAGSWSWTRVVESGYPTIDFTDRNVVAHWDEYAWGTIFNAGPGETGSWLRNPDNGITYSCAAKPVAPTPIYDQIWSEPASTVEPTHTSGYQEYPEPNPDIDGSEPSTIPGYRWLYQHSNVAPAYARVGPPLFEAFENHTFAAITTGSSSGVRTLSVPGARFGDYPSIGAQDLQRLEANVWISAADTVSYELWNRTGGTITLSADFYIGVRVERSTIF